MSFIFLMVPRRRLELLHLAATASKTVMSTIPSPGQIYLDLPDSVMYPLHYASRVWLRCVVLTGLASSHIYHSITWAYLILVLEMGLEPTRPKDIRIWNVRVYHSTTRAYFNKLSRVVRVPLSNVAPLCGCSFSGVWLRPTRFARGLRTYTIPPSGQAHR